MSKKTKVKRAKRKPKTSDIIKLAPSAGVVPINPKIKTGLEKVMDGLPGPLAKVIEAIVTGRYFITISFVADIVEKKKEPGTMIIVSHAWICEKFQAADVVPTFAHNKDQARAWIGELEKTAAGKEKKKDPSEVQMVHGSKELKNLDELVAEIGEAQKSGNILLTVNFQKKYRAQDPHDLQHFRHRHRFPRDLIIESLDYLENKYKSIHLKGSKPKGVGWY